MPRFNINKVAVLGAGVMGVQIAAHLINVKVSVVLFDLPAKEGPKNAIVSRAIELLKQFKPAPLGWAHDAALIQPANYEDDLALLTDCDLVIEAIAERMDYKLALYAQIAPFLAPHAIVTSNTSGLSINELSQALPPAIRARFCGIHFFNPPRYMRLVELVGTSITAPEILDALETFVTSTLGKGMVRAKDTPNFIANRVGIAGWLATLREVENFGLRYDVADDLTGKKLGRASSGTFRTADVVGLDTLAHVIHTLQSTLSLESDPFYASFATPAVLQTLLQQGHLGQKTKAGFFKKQGREILRFDPATQSYQNADQKGDEVYARMLKKPAPERLALLRNSEGAQGQFVWAVLRNSFHYAAVHLGTIADNARDLDLCMRWGFGMAQGPFELWQEAGWLTVAQMVKDDIDAGRALCRAPLPDWVFSGAVAQAGGVHTAQGSWSPSTQTFVLPRQLPVYARQHFPEQVLGTQPLQPESAGQTLHEDAAIHLWTLDNEVLIASLKTKMHVVSPAVVAGLMQGVALAESHFKGMVIWSPGELFSAGADLQTAMSVFADSGAGAIDAAQATMQRAMLRLRYANVPVVSALRGLALGGGYELALYSAQRVAALESYIGLVEAGVGLVPGAGGLTYLARYAAENATKSTGKDLLPFLTEGFTAVAMAKVSTSALEAQAWGYLREGDIIVAHPDELLWVALNQTKALFDVGYRAPLPRQFAVAGRSGTATLTASLINLREGGFISAHDFEIAHHMAQVLCGGDVDAGSLVDERYLMTLERRAFGALLLQPKTQERILGLLTNGKAVRN